ncbi:MAG: SLC13/DASS family transporter [Acidobacteria bacterium]|nr:SLC13/DASS family transporter [Acidobacteriota bacterium]
MRREPRSYSIPALAGLVTGPVLALGLILFADLAPGQPAVTRTLAVALLMAIWWVTEVVPLAVTSLLPVVLFPVLGILDGRAVSMEYFNHVIFLFIGGFIVALAMERWSLHQRIALKVLIFFGVSPARILLGFMLATALLSMWISNTATAMMMLPIALSVILRLETILGRAETRRYAIGLLLGIAYSASIGGIATLVGTPPNLVFVRVLGITFPAAPEVTFAQWFAFGVPLSAIFFVFVWLFLYRLYRPTVGHWPAMEVGVFREQYRQLGPMAFEEKVVLADFLLLAVLWLTRADITVGEFVIPGWGRLLPAPEFINDGTVAVALGLPLFLIPARAERSGRIMDWATAVKLPWSIVLLFGGGFALAAGFKESGLSLWFGQQLQWVDALHPVLIILVICLLMTFLTELTSNTATAQILLPVFGSLAVAVQVNPLLFMIPATISASMAFMLPVATPPNAIVFGTDRLRMVHMARTGLVLNIVGAVFITLLVWFWGTFVFGLDPAVLPAWVR